MNVWERHLAFGLAIVEHVLQEIRSPSAGSERRELFDRMERIEAKLDEVLAEIAD